MQTSSVVNQRVQVKCSEHKEDKRRVLILCLQSSNCVQAWRGCSSSVLYTRRTKNMCASSACNKT